MKELETHKTERLETHKTELFLIRDLIPVVTRYDVYVRGLQEKTEISDRGPHEFLVTKSSVVWVSSAKVT